MKPALDTYQAGVDGESNVKGDGGERGEGGVEVMGSCGGSEVGVGLVEML